MTNNSSALAINNHGDLERIAKMAAASGMCTVRKWEEAAYLLATGYELGLSPMQSLRGIYVVNGKPVLSADLLVAVVRRSGLCESWHVVESTDERCTITTRRKGEPEAATRTWTMADARRAQITGKPIWSQYPRTMLRHRCASDLARDVYPDVILSLYDPEELGAGASPNREPEAPQPIDAEPARPAIDAAPQPLALPSDAGPSPSQASAQRSAEAAAAPPPSDTLKAAVEQVLRASSVAGVAAACVAARDDLSEHEAAALWRASKERVVAVGGTSASLAAEVKRQREESAPKAAPPPDDEPPPSAPKGRRKAAPKAADAAGDVAAAANDGAASQAVDRSGARATNGAPLETREQRRAYLATLAYAPAVRTSYARRRDLPHYREDCAARLCALDPMLSQGEALAYLDAPATQAQRRAA